MSAVWAACAGLNTSLAVIGFIQGNLVAAAVNVITASICFVVAVRLPK